MKVSRVLRAVAWDFSGLAGKQIAAFAISIALARLLEPAEFGIVGIALALIHISSAIFDSGFNSALLQSRSVSDRHFSSVFFVNAALGALLAAAFFLSAPLVSSFYGNESLVWVLRLLSLKVILNALSQVQVAYLQKRLDFRKLAVRDLVSTVAGGLTGIVLALQGWGVYSLVAQYLVAASLQLVLLWASSAWKPRLHFEIAEIRQLAGFSSFVFLDNITSSAIRRADPLVLGKLFSPSILGQFVRANTLNNQITVFSTQSIKKVFFPVMSELQGHREKFESTYFTALSAIGLVATFLGGMLYIWAEIVIVGLFGIKWSFAVFIFRIIVFRSISVSLDPLMTNALLSQGMARDQFKYGLWRRFVARVLPLIVAVMLGFEAFLYCAVGASFLANIFYIFVLRNKLNLKATEQFIEMYSMLLPLSTVFLFDVDSIGVKDAIRFSACFLVIFIGFAVLSKNRGMKTVSNLVLNHVGISR